MPNGKREDSRNRIQSPASTTSQASEGRPETLSRIREGASRVGDSMREGFDATREKLGYQYDRAEGLIAENPMPSMLMSFGLGLGLGVLLAVALTERREPSWGGWHLPESLRDLPERLARHMPDAVARRMS